MGRRGSISKRWAAVAVVAAAVVALPTTQGAGAPERRAAAGERPAIGELPSQVIVQRAIVRPYGFALNPAGTGYYVSEVGSNRLWLVDGAGGRVELPAEIVASGGLGPGPDGSLLIASGTGVTTLAADGTVSAVEVPGATGIDAVGADGSGVVYATDSEAGKVYEIAPGGAVSEVAFTGTAHPRWLDVAEDGTVSVIDDATGDIVRRAPDGTESVLALNVDLPVTFDIDGDLVMVGAASGGSSSAQVVLQLGDGSVDLLSTVGAPGQVLTNANGEFFTDTGLTGCRCPEPPGRAYRMDGEDPYPLPLGDVVSISSVGATAPGTALFSSWDGPVGYSDPLPIAEASLAGPPRDLSLPAEWEPLAVDATPDGTAYIRARRGDSPGEHLLVRTPAGEVSEIPLPDSPARVLSSFSVDEDGRVFGAFGYGYGTGPFEIAEWVGDRWATWYATPTDTTASLLAMAAGGGRVLIVSSESGAGLPALREVREDGTLTTVRELPAGAFNGMDVDVDGNAYLIATSGVKATAIPISVIAADGSTGTITYAGIGSPQALSIGTDGTLYVADAELGLVAIPDVGPVAGDEGVPATPPPAVPVSGNANFTG